MGMRISIPPSIPHFGTTFGTTRTMYHFDTHLGTTPFTTSVDRLTCLGLLTPVECITPPHTPTPGHFYMFCGCVVCSGMIAAVNLPLTFLYSIVWKTLTLPP